MKRHVATDQHQLASIEARVRDLSTGMQPLPPPPCPTPWAESLKAPISPRNFSLNHYSLHQILLNFVDIPVWVPDNTAPFKPPNIDKDTYPWPDRNVCDWHLVSRTNTNNSTQHFLTHLLFRSPELQFSRAQQGAILQWAESCGMQSVPSLYSLDNCDQLLKECGGNPTRKFTSSAGNVYFMNSVQSALQQVR